MSPGDVHTTHPLTRSPSPPPIFIYIPGPGRLPYAAKFLGYSVGRAVGFLHKVRGSLLDYSDRQEITKLHNELKQTYQHVTSIRAELASGGILRSGPMAASILNVASGQATSSGNSSGEGEGGGGGHASPLSSSSTTTSSSTFSAPSFASAPLMPAQPQSQSSILPASSSSSTSAAMTAVLPLSAITAGLAPDRSSQSVKGSEVAVDALMEEHVARQAVEFFTNNTISTEDMISGGSGDDRKKE